MCRRCHNHPEYVNPTKTFLIIVLVLLMVWMITMGIRNVLVYRFRIKLLHQMWGASTGLVDYAIRVGQLERVKWSDMYWKFWIPLRVENWYTDDAFLKPKAATTTNEASTKTNE